MFIPILLGTARKGRRSEFVAEKLRQIVQKKGYQTQIVDVANAKLHATDNTKTSAQAKEWAEIVNRANAIIIVTPEYNHGYPGELKIFLDQLYQEYENKIVGIVSVANGLWGGTRVTEQLRPVLNAYNMIVLGMAIHLRNVGQMIVNDEYQNPEFEQFVQIMLDKINALAEKLFPNPSKL